MDKMDSVAIDPELFMLCRLCTDEKGMFQIVPKVQMQFKDCFDIKVEQFDGLSQLVCGKCKDILQTYNALKIKFREKQNLLLIRRVIKTTSDGPENSKQSQAEGKPNAPAEENKVETLHIENNTVSSTKSDEVTLTRSPAKPKAKSKKRKAHNTKFSLKIKLGSNGTEKDWHVSDSVSKTTKDCEMEQEKAIEVEEVVNGKSAIMPKWAADYVKKFNCRLCSKSDRKRYFIVKHIKSHRNLIKRKKNLIEKECFVSLEPVDGKRNFTGNNCITTLNASLLLESNLRCNYNYITYVSKASLTTHARETVLENSMECLSDASTVDLDTMQRGVSESTNVSDKNSSEDENFIRNSKRMKRTLLLTSSDSDDNAIGGTSVTSSPVVKDPKSKQAKCGDPLDLLTERSAPKVTKPEPKTMHVVNTDHAEQLVAGAILTPNSSKNESLKKDYEEKNITKSTAKINEFKPIRDIITMAYHRTNRSKNKEYRSPMKNDVDLLNKKLLSIGRKVMSKSGYTSIGLLKYLAKRNLHIAWTDHLRSDTKSSKDGNMVRIMTRTMIEGTNNLQGFAKSICTEESGSLDITNSEHLLRIGYSMPSKQVEPLRITDGRVKTVLESLLSHKLVNNQEPHNAENVVESLEEQSMMLNIDEPIEADMPVDGLEATATLLLNKSPATNPKPPFKKKFKEAKNADEELAGDSEQSASLSKCVMPTRDHDYESTTSVFVVSSDDEMVNDSVNMPIIASTTSLAPNQAVPIPTSNPESSVIQQRNESPMPRIKCKPVTDLMPENISHNTNISPQVDAAKIQTVVKKFSPVGLMPSPTVIAPSGPRRNTQETPMIFNTMLLPNTSTHSPFGYFKALLGLHGIKLVKPIEGKNMRSLVKFTLVVQQHPIATELCLDLMVQVTEFCIRVTNNDDVVNIKEMAATWQWEVLKAFKAEKVFTRALEFAEKFNNSTCYNTKLFFNVLTSIQMKSN